MCDPDKAHDDKMQNHLDDAVENVITATDPNSRHWDEDFFQTTDKKQFDNYDDALSHQYKIERGAL